MQSAPQTAWHILPHFAIFPMVYIYRCVVNMLRYRRKRWCNIYVKRSHICNSPFVHTLFVFPNKTLFGACYMVICVWLDFLLIDGLIRGGWYFFAENEWKDWSLEWDHQGGISLMDLWFVIWSVGCQQSAKRKRNFPFVCDLQKRTSSCQMFC